jgi:NDP-sugar pyrophosphorylase family protein
MSVENQSANLPVAILAGGLATRLRPVTEEIPKALVEVAGKPFLAHQLRLLRAEGVKRVVLCVGHLGEMIEEAFGDGSRHPDSRGLRVDYSFDGPKLLGTGGAIKRALPLLGSEFMVLYGDSYLPVSYREVVGAFQASGQPALMTVYRNEGDYDASNVIYRKGTVELYDKTRHLPEMRHIDYGLSVYRAEVFDDVPEQKPSDLAALMSGLVASGKMAGLEVAQRFYEIGSHQGLAELRAKLG